MIRRLAAWLIRIRYVTLGIGVVLAVAFFFPAQKLDFDRSILGIVASDPELIEPYQKLSRTFGGNEVILAVFASEASYQESAEVRKQIDALTQRLKQVPGVAACLSDTEIAQKLPFAKVDKEGDIPPLPPQLDEVFASYTHSSDGKTIAVACMLTPADQTDVDRSITVNQAQKIIAEYPGGTLAGEPVMIVDGFRMVEEDGQRLAIVSTLLLGIVILILFRSLRWTLVPLAVVQWSLLVTRGVLVTSNLELSMVSSMLAAIITVIGVATVIHIIVRFRQREGSMSPAAALMWSLSLLLAPITWACITDAIGFSALLYAWVRPVQDFGLMMTIGALCVLLATLLLVPGLSLIFHRRGGKPVGWADGWIERGLQRSEQFVTKYPAGITVASVLLLLIAGWGITRLEVESDFTKNFRAQSQTATSYRFVETQLGGAGVWDVMLPAPPPEELTWAYLEEVLALETELRAELGDQSQDVAGPSAGLTKVLSIADPIQALAPQFLDPVRKTMETFGQIQPGEDLPAVVKDTAAKQSFALMKTMMPEFYVALYAADPQTVDAEKSQYYLRVMLRSPEQRTAPQKRTAINKVEAIVAKHFPAEAESPKASVTGYYILMTYLIESLVADQWVTFSLATAGIFVAMLLALRNLLLALISLVPNVVPILLVLGGTGLVGLPMNMGGAMIAAVSVGLSVDSSLHYLIAFQRVYRSYRRAGKLDIAFADALAEANRNVGKAMLFSTFALIVGFSSLCWSEFVPTIYFGSLVSLAMIGGLAGNLVLLPALLTLIYRRKKAVNVKQ